MARRKRTKSSSSLAEDVVGPIDDASLAEETQRRYLNYALSVITSRALPDVRDGLKPVQRRILYTMLNELRLRHDVKYRKSAAIVGDVMGKFHPHGDSAIYDALVRLAQEFTMQAPLVDGRGNFGSPDGDAAAAMRYTEARLTKLSEELLVELGKRTVSFRPNYDGTRFEPVVLPARFPNLLVNGSQGIAVGMATSIPPHNLGEVISACLAMIDDPDLDTRNILKHVKGPDFPTGGQLVCSRAELARVYESGHGSLRLRGAWKKEPRRGGGFDLIIHSIPYTVERRAVVEKIADVIRSKKLPAVQDVRDESTEECRIVCELKKDTEFDLVMAYLYKHTPLATNVSVNLTCLVPTDNPEISAPERVSLFRTLRHFLDFRMEVVTKRLQFDLQKLEERIHILEGLVVIFEFLDEAIRIIRKSDGKKDAAQKLMRRFELDELQVEAILELRLYKLAKLEILLIRQELQDKEKQAGKIRALLKSDSGRWKLIRSELNELKAEFARPRRTKIVANVQEPDYDAQAYIVDEDAMVLISVQGWLKRQQRIRDLATTRVREGDRVMEVVAGSTKSSVALFSSAGICYVQRLVDIPQTSGYGVPVQTLLKMGDGERIVAMTSFDARFLNVPEPSDETQEPEEPLALVVTALGKSLRFSLRNHREPSTKSGRRFCRLKSGDEVIYCGVSQPGTTVAVATAGGRALLCSIDEVAVLGGPGQGVTLIRLQDEDRVVAARLLAARDDALVVKRLNGSDYPISKRKYETVSRGGKGHALFKRGSVERPVEAEVVLPEFPAEEN